MTHPMVRFEVSIMILHNDIYKRSIDIELVAKDRYDAAKKAEYYAEKLDILKNGEAFQLGSVHTKPTYPNSILIRIPVDLLLQKEEK